jgi:hypothetical protein
VTLNKKMCLDYDSLKLPETSIFKRSGYMYGVVNYISARKKGLLK